MVSVLCVDLREESWEVGEGSKDKKPAAGCHITKLKEDVEKPRTGKRKIRENHYYAICPLQTDRRHWPFIFLNLRFRESLCCSLVSHTKAQAGVNIKVPANPTLDRKVNLGNI